MVKYICVVMDKCHKYISDATFGTEEEAIDNMQTVSLISNEAYFFNIDEVTSNETRSIIKDAVYVGRTTNL